jgi:hypothetical protein
MVRVPAEQKDLARSERCTLLRGFVGKTALMERVVSLKNLVTNVRVREARNAREVENARAVVDVVN